MNSSQTHQQQYEEEEIPWCYANSTIDTIADDKCFCSVGGCAVPTFEEEENVCSLGHKDGEFGCSQCAEEDDESIIQYRKEIEEGCPEGSITVWDNHGFRYVEEKPTCSNCENPSVVYWKEWDLSLCAECAIKANAKLKKLMNEE